MSELLELKFGDHVLITLVGYVVDIRQRWTGCAMENCALVEVDGHEHAVPVRIVLDVKSECADGAGATLHIEELGARRVEALGPGSARRVDREWPQVLDANAGRRTLFRAER